MEGRNGIQNNYMKCLLEGNNKRPLAISTFHCARDPFLLIPAGAQKLEKINFTIHRFNSPFVWEDWHWCSMGEKWIALPSLCNYLLFFLPSNVERDRGRGVGSRSKQNYKNCGKWGEPGAGPRRGSTASKTQAQASGRVQITPRRPGSQSAGSEWRQGGGETSSQTVVGWAIDSKF